MKAVLLLCLILSSVILLYGCATENAPVHKNGPAVNFITDFLTVEDSETFSVIVKGNRPLTYTATKQSSPPAIHLHFPQTGLERSAAGSFASQNEYIDAIRAAKSLENGRETIVSIDLKHELPHNVIAEGNDVRIVLAKTSPSSVKIHTKGPSGETGAAVAILKKVVVTTGAQEVNIRVMADGVVKDCRTFTIETPPKIVVDCFDLKSNYEKQQKIPVNSSIVSQVRHFGHPDRVRVVAETQSSYLNSYLVEPVADGFAIKVVKK